MQVKIASRSQLANPSPSIFYCTNAGVLAQAGWPGQAVADWHHSEPNAEQPASSTNHHRGSCNNRSKPNVLWQEVYGGLQSFDIHAGLHQEVYCVTSQEGLLHLRL